LVETLVTSGLLSQGGGELEGGEAKNSPESSQNINPQQIFLQDRSPVSRPHKCKLIGIHTQYIDPAL